MVALSLLIKTSCLLLSIILVYADTSGIVTKPVQRAHYKGKTLSSQRTYYLSSIFPWFFCENVCYWEGDTCFYCPSDLYCTTDNQYCCPLPNCENDCGEYCVPPNHFCCEDKSGACPDETSCCENEICCREGSKCCGKDCCPNADTCCKNKRNKVFCIESKLSHVEIPDKSPGYCVKGDCMIHSHVEDHELLDNPVIKYFESLCEIFANGTRKTNPAKSKVQFAVLTLGELKPNEFVPINLTFKLDEQYGNYLSAAPKKTSKTEPFIHAEARIMEKLPQSIVWYHKNHGDAAIPTIFLLTVLSPCKECGKNIISSFRNISSTKYVAWHITYPSLKGVEFLNILKDLLDEEIKIAFSLKGLCKDKKQIPKYVQPTLVEDLFKKYKDRIPPVRNCDSNKQLKESLVKLINWLIWNCRENLDTATNNLVSCFDEKLGKLLPKINPCMDLSETLAESVKILKMEKNFLLSPALDPYSEDISFSDAVSDLEGNYETPFCFQVYYEEK